MNHIKFTKKNNKKNTHTKRKYASKLVAEKLARMEVDF